MAKNKRGERAQSAENLPVTSSSGNLPAPRSLPAEPPPHIPIREDFPYAPLEPEPLGEQLSSRYYAEKREKDRRRRRRRRVAARILWAVLGVILLAAGAAVFLTVFFRVETVTVTGSTIYPEEEILASCGVAPGQNIFRVDNRKVAANLSEGFPYLHSVRVDRDYPHGVTLVLFEEEPYFTFRVDDRQVAVSRDLKVLDVSMDEAYFAERYAGVRQILPPPVSSAIAGGALTFEEDGSARALLSLLGALENSPLGKSVTSIDFRSRFDIRLSCNEGKIDLRVGNVGDIEMKLEFAEQILTHFSPEATGTIFVDDIHTASAQVDDPADD